MLTQLVVVLMMSYAEATLGNMINHNLFFKRNFIKSLIKPLSILDSHLNSRLLQFFSKPNGQRINRVFLQTARWEDILVMWCIPTDLYPK